MNPQAIKIYEILLDGNWHCPIEWGYADGHTKRITDISRYITPRGQKIASTWCDCGRHTSKVLKRKIVTTSPVVPERVLKFQAQWKPVEVKTIQALF